MNENLKNVIGSITVGLVGGMFLAVTMLILEIISRHFGLVEEIGSLTFIFAMVFFTVIGVMGGSDITKKKIVRSSTTDQEDKK